MSDRTVSVETLKLADELRKEFQSAVDAMRNMLFRIFLAVLVAGAGAMFWMGVMYTAVDDVRDDLRTFTTQTLPAHKAKDASHDRFDTWVHSVLVKAGLVEPGEGPP